jgi:nucleotide-binding universal stress UspA family protein
MHAYRNILFAADFSENSKDAFHLASSLSSESRTRMSVLHVVEPHWVAQEPVPFGQSTVPYYDSGSTPTALEALKRRLIDEYTPNHAIDVTYIVKEGEIASEVLRLADETGSDLIVMGMHGRTGLRWLLAGSVAISVLRRAHCQVLALHAAEVPRRTDGFEVILHPTDFSETSQAALEAARSLARERGSRLVLLHVAPLEVFVSGMIASEIDVQIYRETLEETRKRLDGPDLKHPVETRLCRGDASDEIVRQAEELGCGLIVMGTHGRTGLGKLLMGNVAESVLPRAHCPVLVVKVPAMVPTAAPVRPAAQEAVTVF